MHELRPFARWAFLLLAVTGIAGCTGSGTGAPSSVVAPSSSASPRSVWLARPSALAQVKSSHSDKVWICHFSGHEADSIPPFFYDGPDRVIGQESYDPEIGCEIRGGVPLNISREACVQGHDAQPLVGSCAAIPE